MLSQEKRMADEVLGICIAVLIEHEAERAKGAGVPLRARWDNNYGNHPYRAAILGAEISLNPHPRSANYAEAYLRNLWFEDNTLHFANDRLLRLIADGRVRYIDRHERSVDRSRWWYAIDPAEARHALAGASMDLKPFAVAAERELGGILALNPDELRKREKAMRDRLAAYMKKLRASTSA